VTWGMQPIEVIELEQTDLKVNWVMRPADMFGQMRLKVTWGMKPMEISALDQKKDVNISEVLL
jgi:hypothetical protein